MTSVFKHKWRVALAAVALGSIGISGQAFAQNTQSGITITNTVTVNYTVSSVAQSPVTAAAGFVVDTVIKVAVAETGDMNNTEVAPGQQNVFAAFTVQNTGNTAEGFELAAAGTTGALTMTGLTAYVDRNDDGIYQPGAGNDDQTTIPTRAYGSTPVRVFIVGNVDAAATNGQVRDVRLTATARQPTSLAAWIATSGADTAGVDIVIGNETAFADDGFTVASAALAVSKLSRVVYDPFNNTTNPKAIPQARVEYEIRLSNTAGTKPATLVSISDPVPANTTFAPGQYPGTRDVGVKVGAAAEVFCIAEAGSDGNGDGCSLNGSGAVTVGAPILTTVTNGAGNDVVVRFQVTIN